MKCTGCDNEVEEERIELLNSKVCSKCAHSGIAQSDIKGAMIYHPDGTAEVAIMDGQTFSDFEKARKARTNAHL